MWLCIISCLLTIISAVFSIVCLYIFPARWFAITTYSLTVFFLGWSIYFVVKEYRRIKRWFVGILSRNKYTKNIILNYGLNTCIKSVSSTFYNIVYCVFLAVSAYMSKSFWLACLTIYQLALSVTKSTVLVGGFKSFRKKQENPEIKQSVVYRNCGIFLIFMAAAISGMLVQMILMEADIRYPDLLIYAVAVYTVYKVTMTIINMLRAKKSKHLIAQAVRNINFVTSLISLFSLQVALINAFSNGTDLFGLNLISGIGIGAYMVTLGVYMIVKGCKQLKLYKTKLNNDNSEHLITKCLNPNNDTVVIDKPVDTSTDIIEDKDEER